MSELHVTYMFLLLVVEMFGYQDTVKIYVHLNQDYMMTLMLIEITCIHFGSYSSSVCHYLKKKPEGYCQVAWL